MIKTCFLITPIAPSYLRNNRSTRQKSLRCFPICSSKGHINGGFCGQSIRAQMTLNIEGFNSSTIDVNDFVFICEIRPNNEPRISGEMIVRKTEVMDKVRSKQDKDVGKELFMGEVNSCSQSDKELELEIVFNGRHHSWDYSWKSNRWSEQQHVVDIIVLTYDSPLDFRVAGVFTSSQFMILSSHKKTSKSGKPSAVEKQSFTVPSNGTRKSATRSHLFARTSAAANSSEATDQDLLDASNALSMLAGGCLPGASGGGQDADSSDSGSENDDSEDSAHMHTRGHKSVSLPSNNRPSRRPSDSTAVGSTYPSATLIAKAGSSVAVSGKDDVIHLPQASQRQIASSRPLNMSDIDTAFQIKDTVSLSSNPAHQESISLSMQQSLSSTSYNPATFPSVSTGLGNLVLTNPYQQSLPQHVPDYSLATELVHLPPNTNKLHGSKRKFDGSDEQDPNSVSEQHLARAIHPDDELIILQPRNNSNNKRPKSTTSHQ